MDNFIQATSGLASLQEARADEVSLHDAEVDGYDGLVKAKGILDLIVELPSFDSDLGEMCVSNIPSFRRRSFVPNHHSRAMTRSLSIAWSISYITKELAGVADRPAPEYFTTVYMRDREITADTWLIRQDAGGEGEGMPTWNIHLKTTYHHSACSAHAVW